MGDSSTMVCYLSIKRMENGYMLQSGWTSNDYVKWKASCKRPRIVLCE